MGERACRRSAGAGWGGPGDRNAVDHDCPHMSAVSWEGSAGLQGVALGENWVKGAQDLCFSFLFTTSFAFAVISKSNVQF